MANSDNLPRVTATINDGGLRIAPPEAGPKITLLGTTTSTAIDLREIVLVDNAPAAVRQLRHTAGTVSGQPSELSIAVEEAIAAGARNIEVMKIATASGEYYDYSHIQRYDDLASGYDVLLNHPVDIVVPVNAYLDAPGQVSANTGINSGNDPFGNARTNFAKQLADFCYQSTKEHNTAFGVIGVRPPLLVAKDETWAGANTTFTGVNFGTPTLSNISEWVNHVTVTSGTAGEVNHAAESLDLDFVSGAVEDSATLGQVSSTYITNWQALESDGTYAFDNNNLWVDAGAYISVIAAPNRYYGTEAEKLAVMKGLTGIKYINNNGAVAYGAKLTTLDPHIAATNQPISGQRAARALSPTQARTLLRNRFVSMFNKPAGYVVSSAITGAHNVSTTVRSDFVRVSTMRITQQVVDVIRDRGEPFIGKPISGPFLSALEQDIESTLTRIRKTGALNKFDFNIQSSPDQQVLGEVQIDLTLVPAFELVTINAIVSLTKGEGIA